MAENTPTYKTGRLTASPKTSAAFSSDVQRGVQPLALHNLKDGLLYVPKNYSKSKSAALAVMLHGAGGNPEQGLWLLQQYADANNIILIAPASRATTWDIIASNSFGDDVAFIDQALSLVFGRYAINTERIAIGGFSDGASYALCLGQTNGNLFTHLVAFSPGFTFTHQKEGKPAVFVSHGTQDQVLPIDRCSRRIVPQLEQQGYNVNYHEFTGRHEIPGSVSRVGVEWFMQQEEE